MQRKSIAVLLIALLCAVPAVAQQGTAELGGKVVDTGGGVLPGATLVITNEDTGVVREITTTADGSYFASQMVPGRYRITVRMEGFKALDRRGVVLSVGQMTPLDLTMEVGALSETISVTGEAPLIDVTSAEIGGHISATELAELPAAARSYMAFVGSVPGAHFVPAAGFLNDTMLANGQPAAANNVSMDGATNIDDLRGSNVGGQARVANEALQEVQVITNQFDAEYGRASGAVINAVTKSGTNSFSGAAFGFFTGTKVTSRNYFTRVNNEPEPATGKDEWGGTIGGPILRNKLFFFFTVERVTLARPQAATFTARPEFSYSKSTDESAWNTLWRIDHQVSKNNTWAFRWLREYAPQFDVIAGQETLSSNDDETDLDETLVGTLTSVVSNTMVNTVRVGATLEETVHSNAIVRAQEGGKYGRCVPCPIDMIAGQILLPPRLDYTQFDIQADDTMDFSIDDAYSIEDTFSWFIPNKAGRHDVKFGAKYTYVWISNPNNANSNGTYVFGHNLPFDRANPRTYPERLNIRVPGPLEYEMIGRTYEIYAQDKWQIRPSLSLSLGLRYDLEVTPVNEKNNSLFSDASKYPVDKNNIAPRVGLVWNPDGVGKSVVRGGYGIFYDRTLLGTIDDLFFANKYSTSFTANFPQDNPDPGPAAGRLPSEPVLNITDPSQLTPAVRAIINATYPPGTQARNTGTVFWDDPDRKQPYFHQLSAGYERELFANVSLSADYIRMKGKDMFLLPDLNIAHRTNTSRTGPIQRLDPFGVLNKSLLPGEPIYAGTVRLLQTAGYSDYDALNLSLEKRYSNNWNLRAAYSLGYSRGVVRGQADSAEFQVGNNLNLDKYFSPANVDRRHKVTISGRMEIPKTGGVSVSGNLRMMTGEPFNIHDTTFDLDQNGIGLDPLPAGTYNPIATTGVFLTDVKSEGGRNGARGKGFMQLDMRVSHRLRLGGRRTFDIFGEVFNATDHANFTNPSADLRIAADFLRLRELVAITGLPRQAQLGLRFGF
jgi:Carboxypeptidase regulatory-like domain/TonB dependent receptor